MIGYLVLGVSLLLAFLLARSWLVNVDPKLLAKLLRYFGIGLFGALGLALLIAGRYTLAIPLLLAAVAILRRWSMPVPNLRMPGGSRPSGGQTSKVETEFLSMTLEHDSGVMSGQVLKGAYAGKDLAELSLEQLVALLSECHRHDPESGQLLETYLDRTAGAGWRETAQAAGHDTGHDTRHEAGRGWGRRGESAGGGAGRAAMSKDEAREILGLGADASTDEVKEAYRRLMQKLHPDQGGSTYLAAKINQAKDVLLGI